MHIIKNEEPIYLVAPNGTSKVCIHPDGFIEFDDSMDDKTKELIEEMASIGFEKLGPKATPEEVFRLMGWT